jgi:UDP-N-acetylglucosamine 2-epimerase (non-hydrolysing)
MSQTDGGPVHDVHDLTPSTLRVMSIVGARPNFMKIAPIVAQLKAAPEVFSSVIVHTGQHYDEKLSKVFFQELGIPHPDFNLNVGSGSHAQQTAAIMAAFEPVLLAHRPDVLIVVGDVNSTIACALVAAKLGIAIAHVEAGLRSFDRSMPEEINRLLTDQISDLLFTSEPGAADNLQREGVDASKIHFVGNVMIDTLIAHRGNARALNMPARFDVSPGHYGLLTLHRPSNVDDPVTFDRVIEAVAIVSREMPVIFPVHPRTRPMLARSARASALVTDGSLRPVDPLGYVEFLGLMEGCRVALTDSGGIQEETTILGVPCLTLRENTERPATITHGTNQLVGTDPGRVVEAWQRAQTAASAHRVPPLWDGQAARRIVDVLRQLRVPAAATPV